MKELKFDEEKARDLFYRFNRDQILGSLSLSDLFELLELSPVRKYDAGEYIIKQGETDDLMFILLSGQLEIIRDNISIRVLDTPGEVVGEMGLINKEARSASVRAKNMVECLAINTSYLDSDRTSPQSIMFYLFSQILARRLKAENQALLDAKKEISQLKIKLKKKKK